MKTLLACLLSTLTGCAALEAPVAKINDDARVGAELVLCQGISVGSWVRAYGNDPVKADAWRKLCAGAIGGTPK